MLQAFLEQLHDVEIHHGYFQQNGATGHNRTFRERQVQVTLDYF